MTSKCIPQEVKHCLALSDWIYYFQPKHGNVGALNEHAVLDTPDVDIVKYAIDTFGKTTLARYFTYPNGLQAAVFPHGSRIYVVFRGTEPGRSDDFNTNTTWGASDTNLAGQPTPNDANFFGFPLNSVVELFDDDQGSVHSGYWRVLKDAYAFNDGARATGPLFGEPREEIHRHVEKLVKKFTSKPTICVCGHSMGGALANIYAHQLASRPSELKVEVFTFGAPAFGDHQFRVECDALGDKLHITRVANRGDLVTALWLRYLHVANVTYHLRPSANVPFKRYDGYTYNPTTFSAIWCTSKDDHRCCNYWTNLVANVCLPPVRRLISRL
jgi:hypothetical protein